MPEHGETPEFNSPELLPMPVRVVLYVLSIVAAVAAPVIAVAAPEYGVAISCASGILSAAAGGVAIYHRGNANG